MNLTERDISLGIKKLFSYYDPNELKRWRLSDSHHKGPGRLHGYGFAEFIAKRHFEKQGYVVLKHFNLLTIKSKYADNNTRIREAIGYETYYNLTNALQKVRKCFGKIENPDLCVIGSNNTFFVEAKKDRDYLRPPQKLFAIVASQVANLQFVLFKIEPATGSHPPAHLAVSEITISARIPLFV